MRWSRPRFTVRRLLLAVVALAGLLTLLRPMTGGQAGFKAVAYLSQIEGQHGADYEVAEVESYPPEGGWIVRVWNGEKGSHREVIVDGSGGCRVAEGGAFDAYRPSALRGGR
jgi:hypothetical protein